MAIRLEKDGMTEIPLSQLETGKYKFHISTGEKSASQQAQA